MPGVPVHDHLIGLMLCDYGEAGAWWRKNGTAELVTSCSQENRKREKREKRSETDRVIWGERKSNNPILALNRVY